MKKLMEKQIFSTCPFEKKNSEKLIQASKLGEVEVVQNLLVQNRFLVYDFDHVNLKPLSY